jgi:hypothetical protein|tara:strand:- start:754 stop:900 length:147 start_codon:yes stop_codon:yes gene_type:complete
MLIAFDAAVLLRKFGLSTKTSQAELTLSSPAEKFSMCGDVRRRVPWNE